MVYKSDFFSIKDVYPCFGKVENLVFFYNFSLLIKYLCHLL